MIRLLTNLLLLIIANTKVICQADSLSPHSIIIGWEGYFYSGHPNPSGFTQYAIKYAYTFPNKDFTASIGLAALRFDSENALSIPVELQLGDGAFKLGIGGIFNTDGDILAPDRSVFIPSVSLLIHPRIRKKNTFFCLDFRLLFTRHYEGVYNAFDPPYERKGTSMSLGIGLAMGFDVSQN